VCLAGFRLDGLLITRGTFSVSAHDAATNRDAPTRHVIRQLGAENFHDFSAILNRTQPSQSDLFGLVAIGIGLIRHHRRHDATGRDDFRRNTVRGDEVRNQILGQPLVARCSSDESRVLAFYRPDAADVARVDDQNIDPAPALH
jgi:hypothetical protein